MRSRLSRTEYHILTALQKEAQYGYLLLHYLKEIGTPISRATLYNTLIHLRLVGYLRATVVASNIGPSRTVYSLTAAGRQRIARRQADIQLEVRELHASYRVQLESLRRLL